MEAAKENDETIQCDICEHWIYQNCTDIPAEAMKYLGKVKGDPLVL